MDFDFVITARGWSTNSIAESWNQWGQKIVKYCLDTPAALPKDARVLRDVVWSDLSESRWSALQAFLYRVSKYSCVMCLPSKHMPPFINSSRSNTELIPTRLKLTYWWKLSCAPPNIHIWRVIFLKHTVSTDYYCVAISPIFTHISDGACELAMKVLPSLIPGRGKAKSVGKEDLMFQEFTVNISFYQWLQLSAHPVPFVRVCKKKKRIRYMNCKVCLL